jgi:hypothetical protein
MQHVARILESEPTFTLSASDRAILVEAAYRTTKQNTIHAYKTEIAERCGCSVKTVDRLFLFLEADLILERGSHGRFHWNWNAWEHGCRQP